WLAGRYAAGDAPARTAGVAGSRPDSLPWRWPLPPRGGCGRLTGGLPSKCVFVVGSHSIYADEPDRFYHFPPRWLNAATRSIGQWVLYQEPRRAGPRGYYAVARVEQIVRDPTDAGMYLALIEPGSYLEFGRDVPFQLD